MEREFNIVGQRYGKLVVVAFDHYENGASWWLCKCDCGGEKVVSRVFLQNGHTKSCGCLKGQGNHHSAFAPRNLSDKEKAWLELHFKHTKNDELCEKLRISGAFLHRYARAHGLTKSPQFRRKMQKAAADAAYASHRRNGTHPPKGYRVPRSEDFRFKPGHTETEAQKRKRVEKSQAKRNETIRLERIRVKWGLEQKTKLNLNPQDRNVVALRHNLRRRGYIIERGSMTAYYDGNTDRNAAIENRKPGDRNYVAFAYLPVNN